MRKKVEKEFKPYIDSLEKKYNQDLSVKRRVDYNVARAKFDIEENTILYTAFYGRGLLCNPYAVFLHLLSEKRFAHFKHVWVLDDLKKHKADIKRYKKAKNVFFVEYQSEEYAKYLATAKYLINNSTEPYYFVKKKGQVLINTWHGIPLKTMGFDVPGNGANIGSTLSNFAMDDFLLSPDAYMTDIMYSGAYKLYNIYEGGIIEGCYPRFDTLHKSDKVKLIERFKEHGVCISPQKKLILYAPTWKGTDFSNPATDIKPSLDFVEKMYDYIDRSEYQILFKPHQAVYDALKNYGMLNADCVPGTIDANELLSVTDILISDYSSIFFDYLITDKPILFYIPDLDEYLDKRGLYFSVSDLPGPVSKDMEQTGRWLGVIAKGKYKTIFDYKKYESAKHKFIGNYNNDACEIFVASVFDGDKSHIKKLKTNKKQILFHVDVLKNNGITTSAINLMNAIDKSRYDVSLNTRLEKGDEGLLNDIDKNVRIFLRPGKVGTTFYEYAMEEFCQENNIIEIDEDKRFPKDMYHREFLRRFGDFNFDYIINFSGYSGFYSNMLYSYKNAKHYMWMHNDIKAELDKVVNGVKAYPINLPQAVNHYRCVNKVVGCSKATMEVNREKLSTKDTYNKFTWVHNLIDEEKVKRLSDEYETVLFRGHTMLLEDGAYMLPFPEDDKINFITVGRLSVEKNHGSLIKAFSRLYAQNKDVRLYILGDGVLREDTRKLIKSLDLCDIVIMPGKTSNPFAFLKKCQCFILPSIHEGMPMVILEARILNLPIIVSDFSTVKDSLMENGQLIIKPNEDSIYEGMKCFVDGNLKANYKFDAESYNKKCMEEFYALFD